MNLSILETVFVTSWFWLFICAIVSLFSYANGLNHSDDSLNLSTGFSQGWDAGIKAFERAGKPEPNASSNWPTNMVWKIPEKPLKSFNPKRKIPRSNPRDFYLQFAFPSSQKRSYHQPNDQADKKTDDTADHFNHS